MLPIIGAATFGAAILLLAYGLLAADSKKRGVAAALTSIEQHYRDSAVVSERTEQSGEPTRLPTWARTLALRLSPSGVSGSLQRRLDLAGNPASWAADRILAMKGLGLIVGAALGVLFGFHSPALAMVYAAIGAVCLFFLPDVLLYNMGIKRQEAILSGLPDALDMLTVCVEAGLGFDSALAQVARNTHGPLAEEFARALQEMQIGLSRVQALRGMAARTPGAELRAVLELAPGRSASPVVRARTPLRADHACCGQPGRGRCRNRGLPRHTLSACPEHRGDLTRSLPVA